MFQKLFSLILLAGFCLFGTVVHAALVFDHQFVTVDDSNFASMRAEKAPYFLGYQEGLRVSDRESLQKISKELNQPITTHEKFATVGQLGTAGYPLGGVFYIYTESTTLLPGLPGIKQTFISVPGESSGRVNRPLIQDYQRANLEIKEFEAGRFLVARDASGVERNVVVTNFGSRSDLIAIGFSMDRPTTTKLILPIHTTATGEVSSYLWTESGIGTIVFDSRLFSEYFPILQRNRGAEIAGKSCSEIF